MANRSYLYASPYVPGESASAAGGVTGVSQHGYTVPLVHKLLLSGKPQKCKSLIWDIPDEIALVGDYEIGVGNLLHFLDRIKDAGVKPFIDKANAFLSNPANKRPYFVLEPLEIFELNEAPPDAQCDQLLCDIEYLDLASELDNLKGEPIFRRKWFTKELMGYAPKNAEQIVDDLGLRGWSNYLYFDLSS